MTMKWLPVEPVSQAASIFPATGSMHNSLAAESQPTHSMPAASNIMPCGAKYGSTDIVAVRCIEARS